MRLIKFIVLVLLLAVLLTYIFACFSESVASFANENISIPIKGALSALTRAVPIPLFEILAVALPVAVIFLLWRHKIYLLTVIFSLLCALYIVNIAMPTIADDAEGTSVEIAADECAAALITVSDKLNQLSLASLQGSQDYAGHLRYIREELGVELREVPKIKATAFPSLIDRFGTIGYFAFPTAEIIVSPSQPGFMLTFTEAHEMMHFCGVMREDAANMHAFKLLVSSGTPCNEFSAYFAAFTYIGALLARLDAEKYFEIYARLNDSVKQCLSERLVFVQRGKGALNNAVSKANDTVITARDERGAQSYSNTAVLLVRYITERN